MKKKTEGIPDRRVPMETLSGSVPLVVFSLEAYSHTIQLANQKPSTEVALLGHCTREEGTSVYHIVDVYLPDQYCDEERVVITPEGETAFLLWGNEKYGEGFMPWAWLHHHPRWEATPSSQDKKQGRELARRDGTEYFVAVIFNSTYDIFCTVYEPDQDRVFYRTPWQVCVPPNIQTQTHTVLGSQMPQRIQDFPQDYDDKS